MSSVARALARCAALNLLLPASAFAATPADDANQASPEIVVNGQRLSNRIDNAPSTMVTIDAERIATTVNAVSVEDTLKYAPSLIVRKRSIGDNFAPIATRTSGLGSSARSLIYADGALLSALIGNNNGNASPKWQLVTPSEIERIEILYGPFSAAYSGNSIGTVVNITTRMPETLEARATLLVNNQWHRQYATELSLPTGQGSVSIGDRFGRLSFFASATHTVSNAQPIAYATATAAPTGTTGSIATRNRLGAPIRVLGATDIDHHVQDTIKLKATYDVTDDIRASYTIGLFLDSTGTRIESYLRGADGTPVYTSAFNAGLYRRDQRHVMHAAAIDGRTNRFDWQVAGSRYDYARDSQASPTAALPGAFGGGAGSVQRQDGTGWWTIDAKGAIRSGSRDADGTKTDVLSFGVHADRTRLRSQTFAAADWRTGAAGGRTAASLGSTATFALWAQQSVALAPRWVVTIGARQEWWHASGGFNQTSAANAGIAQPARRFSAVSPKATIEWRPGEPWRLKASFGQAWRFPTVGELYQATTVGTVLANPNPDLGPERARSGELALEYRDARGLVRLSLFNEVIDGALISQTAPVIVTQPNGTVVTATASFVQNVGQTRARGIEIALDRKDIFPGIDLTASATYADAITARNPVFAASVGKLLPSVPRWKANAVVTWRAGSAITLTAAARYSSRNFATLDNSDIVADTYQGFDKFFVVDLRGTVRLSRQLDAALGIDNVNNDRYFLFHPFPQRSVTASLQWKL